MIGNCCFSDIASTFHLGTVGMDLMDLDASNVEMYQEMEEVFFVVFCIVFPLRCILLCHYRQLKNGDTVLLGAVAIGRLDWVKLLIDNQADVNSANKVTSVLASLILGCE